MAWLINGEPCKVRLLTWTVDFDFAVDFSNRAVASAVNPAELFITLLGFFTQGGYIAEPLHYLLITSNTVFKRITPSTIIGFN